MTGPGQRARELGDLCMIFLSVTVIPDYAVADIGLIDRVSLGVISPMRGALAGTR